MRNDNSKYTLSLSDLVLGKDLRDCLHDIESWLEEGSDRRASDFLASHDTTPSSDEVQV